MNKTPREDLLESLKDIEFAKLYGVEGAKVNFAAAFVKARSDARLTRSEMACRLGISQPYLVKLERGEANPTIGTVGSLLSILGLGIVISTTPLQGGER